jgi:hypothetical protein
MRGHIYVYYVIFQILTATIVEMAVFRDVAPCRTIALIMEAVSTSETSVSIYQITRRNIPGDSHLQDRYNSQHYAEYY